MKQAGMRFARVALVLLAMAAAGNAAAQANGAYPNKPIRLVVPYPPGGGNDVLGRLVAQKASESMGQQWVVENRSGAAGNIGAAFVAKAPADGYTFLVATSTIAMTPGLGQKVGYDFLGDLVAVAPIANVAMVFAVHPSVPANTLGELIALAKKEPGKLSYSSCGNASPMHLAGELLKSNVGIDMVHVPYRGCAPAITEVVAGQVPVALTTISNAVPYEKSGKLRVLATASPKRLPDFPNLPTVAEASGMRGYQAEIWFGIFAPTGTPREIIERVNAEVSKAVSSPDVKEKLRAQFYEPYVATPAQFAEFTRNEVNRWSRVIKDANIQPE